VWLFSSADLRVIGTFGYRATISKCLEKRAQFDRVLLVQKDELASQGRSSLAGAPLMEKMEQACEELEHAAAIKLQRFYKHYCKPLKSNLSLFQSLEIKFDGAACWASAVFLTVDLCLDFVIAILFLQRGDTKFFALQLCVIAFGAFSGGMAAYISRKSCSAFVLGVLQIQILFEAYDSATINAGIATDALANIRLTRALTEAMASLLIRMLNIIVHESDKSLNKAFGEFSVNAFLGDNEAEKQNSSTAVLCMSVVASIFLLTVALVEYEHW
jgi:hypothetical protein